MNSDNAEFGPGAAEPDSGDGIVYSYNNDNNFNSNGDENGNALAVRPVASVNCGYIINGYIRDNIETDYCPFVYIVFIFYTIN